MDSCNVCSREFKFRFLLQKYLSSHKYRNLQCNVCNRTFSRQDHFTRHIQSCTTDDQIVLSFAEEHELCNAGSTIDIPDTIDLKSTQIYDDNLR